ncbi:hypothetical protein, partial [Brucella melitensis]|uniref:hypothetical protein n=1 Tax=Brucella melitensis TaxID=29459 RepID=UPI003C6CAEB7
GAGTVCASSFAMCNRRSALRRRENGTTRTQVPLRPARPVRPELDHFLLHPRSGKAHGKPPLQSRFRGGGAFR